MQEPANPTALELVLSAVIILVIGILMSQRADAAPYNWCSDWADGFSIGYCWSKPSCAYIPPQMCPEPQPDQYDGYMAGLSCGLHYDDTKTPILDPRTGQLSSCERPVPNE